MDFSLRLAQICKKMYYFGQFKGHNSVRKKETEQMTPFLLLLFVCDIHFFIWKLSKFIFMGPSLWSILFCKIPEFLEVEAVNQNFVSLDSESIQIKESKKLGFTFSIEMRTNWSHLMVYLGNLDYISKKRWSNIADINSQPKITAYMWWTPYILWCQGKQFRKRYFNYLLYRE